MIDLRVAKAGLLPWAKDIVSLTVTSPPYALEVDYEHGDVPAQDWPSFMEDWLHEAYQVTHWNGRLCLNVPLDTTRGGFRPTHAQAVNAAICAGWCYRSTIIWQDDQISKSVARGSIDSASSPCVIARAEMIPCFSKGAWKRSGKKRMDSDLSHEDWLAWTDGTWVVRPESKAWEGCKAAFPEELVRRLLLLFSFPGDIVMDPFSGSGTTAVVAARLGRRFLGSDVSAAAVESTRRRLSAAGVIV